MNKKSIDSWIIKASENVHILVTDDEINSSYDGKTAAFGVSIATMGLKPTLAMYYKESENSNIPTRKILDVIAKMIYGDDIHNDAKKIINTVLPMEYTSDSYKDMCKNIMECAVALKMVIRTYPQIENKNE